MRGGWKSIISITVMCIMVFTLMPMSASAAPHTHKVYYNLNGGWTMWDINTQSIKDNSYFRLNSQRPQKDHYRFKGYHAKRNKDGRWYVAGKGWKTPKQISRYKYTKKIYNPNQRLKMNSSWYGKWDNKSNFTLFAQYTHVHFVNFCYSSGEVNKNWQKDVADNEWFTIDKRLYKNGVENYGWYAKRIDKSGVKWYVAGKGWKTQADINKYGWYKKIYRYGESHKINNSWTQGSNGWADFAFTPVYNGRATLG